MKNLDSLKILIAGDVMLDRYWFGDVNRISPEAPVPIVKIQRIDERLGGAANVARNVASVGAKVLLLGVIGHDESGEKIEKLLAQSNVNSGLEVDSDLTTTIKLRVIGRQQQLVRIDFESEPNEKVLHRKLKTFQTAVSNSDLVILSDYGKGALNDIEKMIEVARLSSKPVVVDPKGINFNRYKGATMITPKRAELLAATGLRDDDPNLRSRICELCRKLGIEALLLTRSEKGMTLYKNNGKEYHVSAEAQEVFDVSGAGDTVIAIMGVMMAAGESFEDAVKWANKAAGLVVAKLGTAVVSSHELFE